MLGGRIQIYLIGLLTRALALLFKLPVGFVENCSGTKEPSAILSRPSVAHPLRPHGYRRPDGSREVNAIGKPADLDELQVAQKSLPCQAAITYPSSSYTPKEVLIERIIPEYRQALA